jgi:hypothetical protein
VVGSGAGADIRTEFVGASHPGWWIVVGYAAAVLVLAGLSTGRRAARSAARVAHLLDAPTRSPEAVGMRDR